MSAAPLLQTLVLIHAYPLSSHMWQEAIPLLAPDLRLVCPDLPGFGQSAPLSGAPSLAAFGEALMQRLDLLDVRAAAFCGVSMGGYLLFDLWRRYPDRIQALIFCDTRAEADSPEARQGRADSIAGIRRGRRREVLERLLPKLLAPSSQQGAALLQKLQAMAEQASDEGLQYALQAMADRPDSRPTLPTIDAPTLVLVGSEDQITPPDAARTIQRGVSGSQLVELPGAGHLLPLEQPEAFTAALRRFLIG